MKSPGHASNPDHRVEESHPQGTYQVVVGDTVIAQSDDVIKVEEDGQPDRFYFPREDVKMDLLDSTDTKSKCPYKGTANYFNLQLGDKKVDDAVWTYNDPFDEHADLKNRLAFYVENVPEMEIEALAA